MVRLSEKKTYGRFILLERKNDQVNHSRRLMSAKTDQSIIPNPEYVFVNEIMNWSSAQRYCRQNFTDLVTYHVVNQPLNWTEAQTYCRQKHTDLATIENSKEMDQLMNTISSFGYSYNFWIGLYNEISWRWSDGFIGSFTGNNYNYYYWTSQDTSHSRSDQLCMVPYCSLLHFRVFGLEVLKQVKK
uniref:C-type lectin domain-containing protein n=1 Tax=Oryzias latipes TaxID=8090 RepID=A0A3B3IHK7_ORYLA